MAAVQPGSLDPGPDVTNMQRNKKYSASLSKQKEALYNNDVLLII
jgi:hypothetical protein